MMQYLPVFTTIITSEYSVRVLHPEAFWMGRTVDDPMGVLE
jgi:hypothetical protein